MNPTWYDVLDVDSTASTDEVRSAWRAAVADLDPTDRRFRVANQAAEVLLDPVRRTAYDDGLAAAADDADEPLTVAPILAAALVPGVPDEGAPETEGRGGLLARVRTGRRRTSTEAPAERDQDARRLPVVPGWSLVTLAALLAVALVFAGILVSKPSDAAVAGDDQAAQAAAERAIVPILSYDAHHLSRSEAAAQPFMTSGEQQQYDKLFAVIKQNAPRTGTVVQARYVASGIVRGGNDRVDVLVFVDQVTHNKQHTKVPVVYRNQVTVTMAKVGDSWLVDGLTTNGSQP